MEWREQDLCNGCVKMEIYEPGHHELVCAVYDSHLCVIFGQNFFWIEGTDVEYLVISNLDGSGIVECILIIECQNGRVLDDDSSHAGGMYKQEWAGM